MEQLAKELEKFTNRLEQGSDLFETRKLCDYGYQITPSSAKTFPDKEVALTLMAVTHGDEVGGIGVLNKFLDKIELEAVKLPFTMNLLLGNPWASQKNKRFLERDLNRSFARATQTCHEEKRAKELEPILRETKYLVDFHQTIEPSRKSFFIFPYEEKGFNFARNLSSDVPIVTHWGGGFSKDGACTDEYVNINGGIGISIELGHKGFDQNQEALGLNIALRSLIVVEEHLESRQRNLDHADAEIYTWAEVLPYPEGDAFLDDGWENFNFVKKGQRLGYQDGEEILAPVSGPILFPKYIREASNGVRPKELCRIMKKVKFEDLGRS